MKRWFVAAFGLALGVAVGAAQQTINTVTLPSGNVVPENAAWSKVNGNFTQLFNTSGNTQAVELCDVAGVDPTGVTDSRAAVQTELNTIAGTSVKLLVDCPVKLAIGFNAANPVFLKSNTTVEFGANGYFICDNIAIPCFVLENQHDVNWRNTRVEYVGQYATTYIDSQASTFTNCGTVCGASSTFQAGALHNFAVANNGNTFATGQNPIWPGATNVNALFYVQGGYRISFTGAGRIFVPDGTSVANYIPVVFALDAEWNYGLNVTSGLAQTPANTNVPDRVVISDLELDGYLMGIVGATTNSSFTNINARRYSDLQDGTSGAVVFSTLTKGASTGTLSGNWPYQTGQYALTTSTIATFTGSVAGAATGTINSNIGNGTYTLVFSDGELRSVTVSSCSTTCTANWSGNLCGNCGSITTAAQIIYCTLTQGQTAATAFNAPVAGTPSLTTSSGNVGGIATWFAPPHLFYMNSTAINYLANYHISNIHDWGQYGGLAVRRSTTSGSALSLKIEVANGSVIDDYMTLRPDGCVDFLAFGNSNGTVKNVYCQFNSSITATNGGTEWGWRWPSSQNYMNQTLENITLVDTAASPASFAMLGETDGAENLNITNLKVFENDWPTGATYYPGFSFVGNNINVQGEIHFNQTNSTQTFRGVLANQGSAQVTNAHFDIRVFGWRLFGANFAGNTQALTFASAPIAGATTTNLASTWANSTGNYTVTFSDSETRSVYFTQGSAGISWTPGLTGAVTTTGNSAQYVPSAATSATLSSTAYPTGWPQSSGVYAVQFSDGEIRYVTLTNGATTATWTGGLTAGVSNAATANGIWNNYVGDRNRVIMSQGGASINVHAHILDVTNQIEQTYDDGIITESWTQFWGGTPTAGSTSFTLPAMQFFGSGSTNFAIDRVGYGVNINLATSYLGSTTLTGVNVGWGTGANTGALITGANITTSNVAIPAFTPISLGGTQSIVLTPEPAGAAFGTTGSLQLSVRGTMQYAE